MSSLGERRYSFEDGAKAGDAILGLIARIDPYLSEACATYLTEQQLAPIINRFRELSKESLPCVEGLLSRLIKPRELNSNLLTLWGAGEFWENQKNYAPICEIQAAHGFIQIGSWCGHCDGDAWIIDTDYGRLASLSLNLLDYDPATVRKYCYELFHSPWQWFSFLRCLAWERGWIPEN